MATMEECTEVLRAMWQFSAVYHFSKCFRSTIGLKANVNYEELEAAFVSTEERILFHDLHCKLLRGLYEHDTNTQNAITFSTYIHHLMEVLRTRLSDIDDEDWREEYDEIIEARPMGQSFMRTERRGRKRVESSDDEEEENDDEEEEEEEEEVEEGKKGKERNGFENEKSDLSNVGSEAEKKEEEGSDDEDEDKDEEDKSVSLISSSTPIDKIFSVLGAAKDKLPAEFGSFTADSDILLKPVTLTRGSIAVTLSLPAAVKEYLVSVPLRIKVLISWCLCEWWLDENSQLLEYIRQLPDDAVEELQVLPLGEDGDRNHYFYFNDCKLFREAYVPPSLVEKTKSKLAALGATPPSTPLPIKKRSTSSSSVKNEEAKTLPLKSAIPVKSRLPEALQRVSTPGRRSSRLVVQESLHEAKKHQEMLGAGDLESSDAEEEGSNDDGNRDADNNNDDDGDADEDMEDAVEDSDEKKQQTKGDSRAKGTLSRGGSASNVKRMSSYITPERIYPKRGRQQSVDTLTTIPEKHQKTNVSVSEKRTSPECMRQSRRLSMRELMKRQKEEAMRVEREKLQKEMAEEKRRKEEKEREEREKREREEEERNRRLEKEEKALKVNRDRPWQLICSTLDQWEAFERTLSKSNKVKDKELLSYMQDFIFPDVYETLRAKLKADHKAEILNAMPRKRSARIYTKEIIKAAEEVLGEQRAIERQHQYEEAERKRIQSEQRRKKAWEEQEREMREREEEEKRKQEEKAERERQKAREERLRKREEMIAERQYQEERKKQQLIEARANRAKKITAEGRSESLDTLLQTSQKEAESQAAADKKRKRTNSSRNLIPSRRSERKKVRKIVVAVPGDSLTMSGSDTDEMEDFVSEDTEVSEHALNPNALPTKIDYLVQEESIAKGPENQQNNDVRESAISATAIRDMEFSPQAANAPPSVPKPKSQAQIPSASSQFQATVQPISTQVHTPSPQILPSAPSQVPVIPPPTSILASVSCSQVSASIPSTHTLASVPSSRNSPAFTFDIPPSASSNILSVPFLIQGAGQGTNHSSSSTTLPPDHSLLTVTTDKPSPPSN